MGVRGFLYALIDDLKFEIPSVSPELDPGRLPPLDGALLDSSDWWLDPGREDLLEGREGGRCLAVDVS